MPHDLADAHQKNGLSSLHGGGPPLCNALQARPILLLLCLLPILLLVCPRLCTLLSDALAHMMLSPL